MQKKLYILTLLASVALCTVEATRSLDCCSGGCYYSDKENPFSCSSNCSEKKACTKECDVCTPEEAERSFKACLSFEQAVKMDNTARPASDKPDGVCGTFEICFNKELTQAAYKVAICGADGEDNPNERVIHIILSATSPGKFALSDNEILILFSSISDTCGTTESPLIFAGKLTNSELKDPAVSNDGISYSTIAALYAGCRSGKIKVVVCGSNDCVEGKTGYGFVDGGLITGQIFAAETNGL